MAHSNPKSLLNGIFMKRGWLVPKAEIKVKPIYATSAWEGDAQKHACVLSIPPDTIERDELIFKPSPCDSKKEAEMAAAQLAVEHYFRLHPEEEQEYTEPPKTLWSALEQTIAPKVRSRALRIDGGAVSSSS